MKNCKNCKRNCEYRGTTFKNMTIRCSEKCPLEMHKACQKMASAELRLVYEQLKEFESNEYFSTKGILTQLECLLNAADEIK